MKNVEVRATMNDENKKYEIPIEVKARLSENINSHKYVLKTAFNAFLWTVGDVEASQLTNEFCSNLDLDEPILCGKVLSEVVNRSLVDMNNDLENPNWQWQDISNKEWYGIIETINQPPNEVETEMELISNE